MSNEVRLTKYSPASIPISDLRQAEVSDLIIEKFRGNRRYNWAEITDMKKNFLSSLEPDIKETWAEIQNITHDLIDKGILRDIDGWISLDHKGWMVMYRADRYGCVSLYKEKLKEEQLKRDTYSLSVGATIAAIVAVLLGILALPLTPCSKILISGVFVLTGILVVRYLNLRRGLNK